MKKNKTNTIRSREEKKKKPKKKRKHKGQRNGNLTNNKHRQRADSVLSLCILNQTLCRQKLRKKIQQQ